MQNHIGEAILDALRVNGARAFVTAAPAALALSTNYASRAITLPTSTDYQFVRLLGDLDTIAGGALSITWWLSETSDGRYPITNEVSTDVLFWPADATRGGVTAAIQTPQAFVSSPTSIYLWAKTGGGTCNITPYIIYTAAR